MWKQKWGGLAAAVIFMVAVLNGCGEKDLPVNDYKSPEGMYQVSLPGEWETQTEEQANGEMLELNGKDNVDVLAIGIHKELADAENLEEFQNLIDTKVLNGIAASSSLKGAEAVGIPDMKKCIASEGTLKDKNGAKAAIFVEYMETEKAYYMLVLSANDGKADKLDPIKEKMSLKELKVEEIGKDTPASVLWFNAAYAVLIQANQGNVKLAGGFEPNDLTKESMAGMLKRDWEVTDKESADKEIKSLMKDGHNAEALAYLDEQSVGKDMSRKKLQKAMKDSGFSAAQKTVMLAVYDARKKFGDKAILAWDESRAVSIYGFAYLAGFYTYEEAMEGSLKLAKQIQKDFDSWDDFMESYFYGFEYWSGEDLDTEGSQAAERYKLYEEMKEKKDGPYSLDWNMKLKKDWK